jgi:hypothetical protein
MSQDIGTARTRDSGFGLVQFRWWAGWSAGAVVALGGVEDQFAEELAGGGRR